MKFVLFVVLMMLLVGCTAQMAEDTSDDSMEEVEDEAMEETMEEPEAMEEVDAKDASLLETYFERSVEFQVTYDIESKDYSGEMTQYIKGSKIRVDVETQGINAQTYVLDKVYSCTDAQGSWMCFTSENDVEYGVNEDVKENVADYEVVAIGDKVVAGVNTKCFRIEVEDGTVEYCYSGDNVPLYVKTITSQGTTELTATTYSTSVSDSVFELPAEPGSFDFNY